MNIILSIIFVIALLFEILFKIVLKIPVDSTEYKIYELIANISYSYVVSYIFYLIAIIPNYKNTKTVKTILLQKSKKICSSYEKFFNDIKKHPRNVNINFDDRKQWDQALNNILLLDNVQHNMITVKIGSGKSIIPKTYFFSMLEFQDSVINTINEIKETSAVIDQNLYLILNKIETSSLITMIKSADNIMQLNNVNNKNTITMNVLSNTLEQASDIISELQDYITKYLPEKTK